MVYSALKPFVFKSDSPAVAVVVCLPAPLAKPVKLKVTSVGTLQFMPRAVGTWGVFRFWLNGLDGNTMMPRKGEHRLTHSGLGARSCQAATNASRQSKVSIKTSRRTPRCVQGCYPRRWRGNAMGGQAPFQNDAAQADPSRAAEHAQETDGARPLGNQRFVQRTHGPKLSDGRMKPRPMRPRMAKATSIHSEEPRLTNTIRPKDSASSPNPILTKMRGPPVCQAAHEGDGDGQYKPAGGMGCRRDADNSSPSCI